ncbi:MAG: hypothetical protein ACKVU4_03385, partial [Phycisphaerales bacterium]
MLVFDHTTVDTLAELMAADWGAPRRSRPSRPTYNVRRPAGEVHRRPLEAEPVDTSSHAPTIATDKAEIVRLVGVAAQREFACPVAIEVANRDGLEGCPIAGGPRTHQLDGLAPMLLGVRCSIGGCPPLPVPLPLPRPACPRRPQVPFDHERVDVYAVA